MEWPTIEPDPYGKDIPLQRCHVGRPFTPTPEHVAAAAFVPGSPAWQLLMKIAATKDYTVEHGKGESFVCYRGYRIGGIDREKSHWFVSKTFGTYAIDKFLRGMKFESASGHFGAARQNWYETGAEHVAEFEHTVSEISKAIDRQLQAVR